MTALSFRLYNGAPSAVRTVLASLHGYRLRRIRYGANSEQLVERALERDFWTRDQWRLWLEEELARVLHRAATRVPYYRDYWQKRRRLGDRSSWEVLANWPVLTKSSLRAYPRAFVADDVYFSHLRHETTSGTTGQPIHIWFRVETERAWYALCEARWRRWNGLSRHDRWAMLGAQLIKPIKETQPPFWVWNAGLHQLYMSAYHLFPEYLGAYLDALASSHVRYVLGHSATLDTLAREVLRTGRCDIRLQAVLSSSEPLTATQRSRIGTAFQSPVKETYGMAEWAAGASECEHGHMHLWPEVAWTETVDSVTGKPSRTAAMLLATTLLNPDMPLIRYQTGDLVSLPQSDVLCSCGRSLPVLSSIEGRCSDSIITPDGRRVSPSAAEMIFETDLPILEAQLVQDKLDQLQVFYVPANGYEQEIERRLYDEIQSRIGPMSVTFTAVQQIPRGPNAKFRAVVCRLNQQTNTTVSGGIQ